MTTVPTIEPLDARRLFSGAPVPSFGRGGVVITGTIHPGDVGGTVLPYGNRGGFFVEDKNHLLTRYLPNGSIDPRFKPLNPINPITPARDVFNEQFDRFATGPDGSVYAIRHYTDDGAGEYTIETIQHYTQTGRLDRAFGGPYVDPGGGTVGREGVYEIQAEAIPGISVADDRSLYLAAAFADFDSTAEGGRGSGTYNVLVHVPADGDGSRTITRFDVSRDTGGGLLRSSSGELYLTGGQGVSAFKPDMTPDKAFGIDGTVMLSQYTYQGAIGTHGDLTLLTANSDFSEPHVVRLTSTGRYDASFGKRGIAALPDNTIQGVLGNFMLEPDNTLLLASQYPTAEHGDYVLPVIQEIDSAGHLRRNGFNHGVSSSLIAPGVTPASDTGGEFQFLQLTRARDGNVLAAFTARQRVGDRYRLVSVLEEFTGT